MKRIRKSVVYLVLICVLVGIGIHDYSVDKQKTNFTISNVSWNGDAKSWTDNTTNNIYDVGFQLLDGKDISQINSKKSDYTMKIDSSAEIGDVEIKVYNDKKILFQKDGNISAILKISSSDSKNVKVEITGKSAKGHVKITLT